MLCNLLTGLRGSLLRRGFVIGALDTEAMDLCRIEDWACFDLRGNVTGLQGADMQSAGKVAWVEFTWAKAWMTSAAMRLGYRVLAVDTGAELAVVEPGITGFNTEGWEEYSTELPPAALGQEIVVEFLFQSDSEVTDQPAAGWYLDDVTVTVPAP